MDELARTLERCLRRHLPLVPQDRDLDLSAELFDYGLDSMSAIALLLEIEGAFSIHFPDEMLDPDTFRTADTLLAAIRGLMADQSVSGPRGGA